jgi:heat shock protein HslJ
METKNRSMIIYIFMACVVVVVGGVIAFRWSENNTNSQGLPSQDNTLQQMYGTITQVETGKDGGQVELETETGRYSVTINALQAEIEGDFEQIQVGTEIEVTGQLIDGMDPPLIVAEHVTVLETSPQLSGETWVLTTINDQQPINDHQLTLQFDAGQISGSTGCNHYGGTYQIAGDSIRFEGIYSTEMACLEPEGLMDQERAYLELLRVADQFELANGVLTLFAESKPILVFMIQSDEPLSVEPVSEPEKPAPVDPVPSPTSLPVFEPPEGWHHYQDPATGISIYIPEDWIVTGIIEGEYAILQSYPEDKYIGGEGREEGDTKCDLNIRPEGDRSEDLIAQWQSEAMTTIVSEENFSFQSGLTGQRFVIDSMGWATVFITEINQRVVLLTCFGDFSSVDEIAVTLKASE